LADVTVVVPLAEGEVFRKSFTGEADVIVVRGGSHSYAKNVGGYAAKTRWILFLDSDIDLMGLDLGVAVRLAEERGLDLATGFYETSYSEDAWNILVQNFHAALNSPIGCLGGFQLVRKRVFEALGGFKHMYSEDIEFANRAWFLGYRVGSIPVRVKHTRRFTPALRWVEKVASQA